MMTSVLRTVALLVLFHAFWGSEARSRALLQDASPCGQVSSSGPVNITTNSVVLITSPLVSANEALTICSCLPGCYTLANQGDLLPSNPNVPSGAEGLKSLLNQNLNHGQGAWLASPYNCTSVDTGPDGSIIETGLADCGGGQATLCSKSRITRNGEGASCDNQLEQCAAGLYCDPQTNTCAPDMVCQPDNPCASNLTGSEASNAFCTVNSTAPGGYTCQCGAQTAVSLGPGPQQCVLCPSANPCAATLCPVGSYCEFTCGDPRGPVCTPSDGTAASP